MKHCLFIFAFLFAWPAFAGNTQNPDSNAGILDWDPPWFDRTEVAIAAHEFSEEAEHFHRAVESVSGYNHLAADAHRLSEAAEHFHEYVENGASYWHLLSDYRRLELDYRHLVRAWHYAHNSHHNWHLESDFRQMDDAFRRLNYSMHDWNDDHGGGHGNWPWPGHSNGDESNKE